MSSLFTHRGALPGHPESKHRNRPVPTASPASKPFSSCKSVRVDSSCPEPTADPLLGFCLSEGFSCHALDPRPARATKTRASPFIRRFRGRFKGLTPLEPGEPTPTRKALGRTRRRTSDPVGTGPHRLSTASPTPMALELRASPSLVTFEALKYVESGVSPKRAPPPLRFVASSPAS